MVEQQLASSAILSQPGMGASDSAEPGTCGDESTAHQAATQQLYEGNSSFTRQSMIAIDRAQAMAMPSEGCTSTARPSLERLSTLLPTPSQFPLSAQYRFSNKANKAPHTTTLEHVPLDLVLAILQEIKGS